jgi:DNA-binding NarL/FixJ family response regulator
MSLSVLEASPTTPDIRLVCTDEARARRIEATLAVMDMLVSDENDAAVDSSRDGRPVLVILASDLTPTARTSAIRELRGQNDDAHIVVCHAQGGSEVRRALQAGAHGYVLEDSLERTLIPTIASVLAGQVAVPRQAHQQIGTPRLSPREKQVLGLVVMGCMNHEIAKTLYVSESTVKSHLSSAFTKLAVRSRTEAVDLILDPEQGLGRGILAITDDVQPASKA